MLTFLVYWFQLILNPIRDWNEEQTYFIPERSFQLILNPIRDWNGVIAGDYQIAFANYSSN